MTYGPCSRPPDREIEVPLRANGESCTAWEDGAALPWPEFEGFAPVRGVKGRHRCVGLPFEALVEAFSACFGVSP